MVTKGSGDKGKWWRREVVTKGSGDDGKWWRREVVTKGSGDEGKWWRREVVTKGSGDEGGKWWGCRLHWNGAWALCWGGSRSTKPCFFPCKVAAGGDASCVRRVRLRSACIFCRIVTVASSCFRCACVCVVIIIGCFGICGCRSHWNGCMNVAWALFWGGSRSTKPCIFPCKVAAGGDERYLVCAAGVAAVVPDAIGSFYVFCNEWLFLWA